MKNLFFILLTCLVSNLASSQILNPINPIINGVNGSGLVDEGCKFCFTIAPAKNATDASTIWSKGERFNFLNAASINGTNETGSAYVDLISDYLGPVRIALSSTVAATDKEEGTEEDKNIEKFLSGGGSAIINSTFIGPTLSWNTNKSYLTLLINPKVGFDFPALGSNSDDGTVNLDFGLELKFNMPLAQNNLGFIGHYRFAQVFGGEKFYEEIGLTGDDASSFGYSQISLGFTLPGINWAILWNKTITGPDNLSNFHKNGRISLIISPK